jgi:Ser/Thr protein kinase RdoA (MazF antagonist)
MERGWERAYSFRRVWRAEAEGFVRLSLPSAKVARVEPLTAGLRNTNYRVELVEGRALVLRIYTADPSACARESAILAALAGRVPVPRVLHSEPSADPPFSLFDWIEGRPLDGILAEFRASSSGGERGREPGRERGRGRAARQIAFACGSALASIHALRFPTAGFFGPDLAIAAPVPDWDAAVLSALEAAEPRIGPQLAGALRRTVESNARAVHGVWSEAALVHADFKPWNLLYAVDGDGAAAKYRLAGVIDWEFACAGCRLIDFGTFLRDATGHAAEGPAAGGSAEGYASFVEAFVEGYEIGGAPLPPDWRRLTLLVDLLSLVQMSVWARGRGLQDIVRLLTESERRLS